MKQKSLNGFLKYVPKRKEESQPEQIVDYSDSYYFIKNFLTDMLK